MIGIDTNVLIRLIVADDIRQMEMARQFIRERCSPEAPGLVNLVVMCELVWTLDRVYRFGREDIADAVAGILDNPVLAVDSRAWVASTLKRFRDTAIDFPDLLISEINRGNGCKTTATFDRKAARLDGFMLVR